MGQEFEDPVLDPPCPLFPLPGSISSNTQPVSWKGKQWGKELQLTCTDMWYEQEADIGCKPLGFGYCLLLLHNQAYTDQHSTYEHIALLEKGARFLSWQYCRGIHLLPLTKTFWGSLCPVFLSCSRKIRLRTLSCLQHYLRFKLGGSSNVIPEFHAWPLVLSTLTTPVLSGEPPGSAPDLSIGSGLLVPALLSCCPLMVECACSGRVLQSLWPGQGSFPLLLDPEGNKLNFVIVPVSVCLPVPPCLCHS